MNAFAKVVATAFGAGYSPVAPGTMGTLVAVPLVYLATGFGQGLFVVITTAIIGVAIGSAHVADRAWGSDDNQRIVIDEVAGYFVTMTVIVDVTWPALAAGFFVFRFFDIVKPPPIRWLDTHVPGGLGVVLDDVAAGAMGAAVMALLVHFGALS